MVAASCGGRLVLQSARLLRIFRKSQAKPFTVERL